jgi:hypothetical protein
VKKKGVSSPGILIAGVITIIVAVMLIPIMRNTISDGSNIYSCTNVEQPIPSIDKSICTNASYLCLDPVLPILDGILCTNASGIGKFNASATIGFSAYNESSTYQGLSTGDIILLNLFPIFLALTGLMALLIPIWKGNK